MNERDEKLFKALEFAPAASPKPSLTKRLSENASKIATLVATSIIGH